MPSIRVFAALGLILCLSLQTQAQDNKFASERIVEPFTKALRDRRPATRIKAVEDIVKLGADAELAMPDLLEALRDPNRDVRRAVSSALPKLGPKVVPGLLTALKDRQEDVRFLAVMTLAELGPAAHEATPVLIQALRLGVDQRVTIVVALGKIGKAAVPELIFLLQDSNAQRRYDALWALSNIGPEARAAASAIVRLLADKDANVRAKAVYALFRVWPEATILTPRLPAGPGT